MSQRIRKLPPFIANQIAAGEIIERPASVVKELLENSLDAGASMIAIEISYGGLNQIKISDNGLGIIAEDLPLAIAAHATSKISSLDDLYAINSMGFRGEALASIASVAKLSISSKPEKQKTAMILSIEGAKMSLSPCAHNVGTTVEVMNLFFNAPVRRRFLKSERLEFQAIETVVKRFALSAPELALTLKHNGKLVLSLPAATTEQSRLTRIQRILGSAFVTDAIQLDAETSGMKLYGWISGMNFQRSQNDRLWVYINQRMVKDKLIYHALKQAYDGVLDPGRFPACALYLTVNHAEVDVNVHPTKHEVRFQQPRLVHDFFRSQLTTALKSSNNVNKEINYIVNEPRKDISQEIYEPYPLLLGWNKSSEVAEARAQWFILNNRYIVTFIGKEPYLVDAIFLQKQEVRDQLFSLDLPLLSRPLLVPVHYFIPKKLQQSAAKLSQYLEELGIQLECIGENKLLIRSIPLQLPYLDLPTFLGALAELEVLQNHTQFIELMIQSQAFDPHLLDPGEQERLHALLLRIFVQEETKNSGLLKRLSLENCRNLMHA